MPAASSLLNSNVRALAARSFTFVFDKVLLAHASFPAARYSSSGSDGCTPKLALVPHNCCARYAAPNAPAISWYCHSSGFTDRDPTSECHTRGTRDEPPMSTTVSTCHPFPFASCITSCVNLIVWLI